MAQPNDRTLKRKARARFAIASKIEKEYVRSLNQLTNQIDSMVKGMTTKEGVQSPFVLEQMLRSYSATIRPWAESVAEKMLARIQEKDENAWTQLGREVGRQMRKELETAPTGEALRKFLHEQVTLIQSLPIEAAERVHKLTIQGLAEGKRAEDVAKEILKTGSVSKSRAQLIARTEISRTASGLTQARAEHVGSTHYYWRTIGDHDVRDGHKEMNGKICEWANPPAVNEGTKENPKIMHHHPGNIWNCRCYAEPIIE